jgi:D-arabinose 1-dehydrogenase-like Zn-dependent alcohol dehydrogenase
MVDMIAARFTTATRKLELKRVPIPEPKAGEVLVRIAACGICLSDVHVLDGTLQLRVPEVTLGHEAAGTIDCTGSGVPAFWRPGMRVVIMPGRACGSCPACVRGGTLDDCLGPQVMGNDYDGAWAEFCAVPYTGISLVPESIPFEQAAILADAVTTPYGGLIDTGNLRPGESVGLWGVGGLGVHAIQIARLSGAAPIFAIDTLPAARERALSFGADYALDPADSKALRAAIYQATGKRGLDLAVDMVGLTATRAQADSCLGMRGRLILIGLTGEPIHLDNPVGFTLRMHAMQGHLGGKRKDLDALVKLVETKRLDLSRSITEVMPLSQVARGVRQLEEKIGNPIRLIVRP